MTPLLVYLAKVVICSGILYGYYHLALRNNRFHQWNRYYLLLCTVLSLVVPLLRIPLPFTGTGGSDTIYVYTTQVVTLREQVLTPSSTSVMASINWSTWLYAAVLLALLLRIAAGYWKIFRLVRGSRVEFLKPYWLVLSEKITAPFSFFRYIFWNSHFSAETTEGRQILRHEMVHLQERHSADKFFMELVTAVCWINPFFHLIKRELSMIHEFIADRKAVVNGDVTEYAQSILQMALQSRHSFSMANSFSHQPIKRRILMLTQSRNLRFSYLRRLLILPLAVLIFCSLAFVVNEEGLDFNPASGKGPAIVEVFRQADAAAAARVSRNGRDTVGYTVKQTVVVGYQRPAPPPPPRPAPSDGQARQDTTGDEVFTFVEQPPTFIGGEQELAKYLNKNIRYPKEATEKGISGTVFVSFIVNSKGEIKNARTVGTPKGGGLEEEALRVVKEMPNWRPGKQNGRQVAVQFNLPIRFALTEAKKDAPPITKTSSGIYRTADQMPSFAGGEAALARYLSSSLRYPAAARNGKIQGNVLASFVVKEDGSIDRVTVISKQLGGGLEEEAMRVIQKMPKWQPAMDKGKAVPAEVQVPIAFRLQ
ncbi:M56 family metallopeptidase [Chitinophaga sp.]|uniref:M56 family metallopeptidase n=1 Tax=Chitinophaga sp. TaxID=1869181 RepID=UPI0031E0A913